MLAMVHGKNYVRMLFLNHMANQPYQCCDEITTESNKYQIAIQYWTI